MNKLFHPEMFQGDLKMKNYFEGWYFKLVSRDQKSVLILIPGISLAGSKSHAFIQVLDGRTGDSDYLEFPLEQFSYSRERFEVTIGRNVFSREKMVLDILRKKDTIRGEVMFLDAAPYPVTVLSPGIMGPFAYVPAMECYHGVVSMTHRLKGKVRIGRKTLDFGGGKGYIEKDWGKSFPSTWLWVQTNYFKDAEASFMLSVARIPWLGLHFVGFLCFLKTRDGLYRFMTYTGAKIKKTEVRGNRIEIRLEDAKYSLNVRANRTKCGTLKAPVAGKMDRRINECVNSEIEVLLVDRRNKTIFRDTGTSAGIELVGNILELVEGS